MKILTFVGCVLSLHWLSTLHYKMLFSYVFIFIFVVGELMFFLFFCLQCYGFVLFFFFFLVGSGAKLLAEHVPVPRG